MTPIDGGPADCSKQERQRENAEKSARSDYRLKFSAYCVEAADHQTQMEKIAGIVEQPKSRKCPNVPMRKAANIQSEVGFDLV